MTWTVTVNTHQLSNKHSRNVVFDNEREVICSLYVCKNSWWSHTLQYLPCSLFRSHDCSFCTSLFRLFPLAGDFWAIRQEFFRECLYYSQAPWATIYCKFRRLGMSESEVKGWGCTSPQWWMWTWDGKPLIPLPGKVGHDYGRVFLHNNYWLKMNGTPLVFLWRWYIQFQFVHKLVSANLCCMTEF